MERVVTVNLNGNPYQLEEPAHDALRAYMDRAEAALAANPDRAEVVRDLEQAIADKCDGYLSPSKRVVSAAEMSKILQEMGPVESGAEDTEEHEGARDEDYVRPPRRLYRIYDRHAWTGVSAGLAAYAGIDPAWVRVFWILSALFTGGFTILVYLVLIFAMPVASTSAEMAAAHGAPFNAQEVIDRAKRQYSRFADDGANAWQREERAWRRSWRRHQRAWRETWGGWGAWDSAPPAAPAQPVGYITRMFAGLFAFVFSIITAALLIAFLVALFSLLNTGAVLGWTPPGDIPNWLAIVILCIAYAALSSPFSALRRSSYATASGHRYGGGGDGLVTLFLVGLAVWLAYLYWPEARDMLEHIVTTLRSIALSWRDF